MVRGASAAPTCSWRSLWSHSQERSVGRTQLLHVAGIAKAADGADRASGSRPSSAAAAEQCWGGVRGGRRAPARLTLPRRQQESGHVARAGHRQRTEEEEELCLRLSVRPYFPSRRLQPSLSSALLQNASLKLSPSQTRSAACAEAAIHFLCLTPVPVLSHHKVPVPQKKRNNK